MLKRSDKTNLLEQHSYVYDLQDVATPNLYTEIYDYAEIPKVPFNHRRVPLGMADEIWITDTSFRDGQQSVRRIRLRKSQTCSACFRGWAGRRESSARRNFSHIAKRIGKP